MSPQQSSHPFSKERDPFPQPALLMIEASGAVWRRTPTTCPWVKASSLLPEWVSHFGQQLPPEGPTGATSSCRQSEDSVSRKSQCGFSCGQEGKSHCDVSRSPAAHSGSVSRSLKKTSTELPFSYHSAGSRLISCQVPQLK